MTVRVWIVMELLAAGALVLYCALPAHLEIGAIATTMLGTLMTALIFVGLIDVSQFAAKLARKEAQGADGADEAETEGEPLDVLGAPAKGSSGTARLERILGLDEDSTLADARHAVVRHNAELMGAQFLLSEREVEVLALYA